VGPGGRAGLAEFQLILVEVFWQSVLALTILTVPLSLLTQA
jgi:hypothetical protein